MNDKTTEQLIQAAGANAPRLTPDEVQAAISSEHYINAGEALAYCTPQPQYESLKLVTICILILKNGFNVVGTSAPVSATNFRDEIGRKVARDHAISQIWALEGYLLKQKLFENDQNQPSIDQIGERG